MFQFETSYFGVPISFDSIHNDKSVAVIVYDWSPECVGWGGGGGGILE